MIQNQIGDNPYESDSPLPHPDDLSQQMAEMGKLARDELGRIMAREETLRRIINVTDAALNAAAENENQPEQAGAAYPPTDLDLDLPKGFMRQGRP